MICTCSCMPKSTPTYRVIDKGGAVVQAGVVVEELDVARLQDHLQAQLLGSCQLIEQRHGLVVRRRQARHLLEALTQQVVIVRVVDAQVALRKQPPSSKT